MKKIIITLGVFLAVFASIFAAGKQKIFLKNPGNETIVDYLKYGKFKAGGTNNFHYDITDKKGLIKACGTGIYPDETSVFKDPLYKKFKRSGKLVGDQWNFVNTRDTILNFYKWASLSNGNPAVKQWYSALMLEKSGFIEQAIKAYYAIIVHFPKSYDLTYFKTPWYPGRAAVDKIDALCRNNPQKGLKLVNCSVKIVNGFNNSAEDDVFYVRPGKIVSCSPEEVIEKKEPRDKMDKVYTYGKSNIKLNKYSNNNWELTVDGKPFLVKGVAYSPNKVGLSPDNESLTVYKDFLLDDYNKNGHIDGPYDAWVDKNENNVEDADEPAVGDFQLMKDMGVNTIRLYHNAHNKPLLRDLYNKYGIRVIMGDYCGMYAIGSGESFAAGADYKSEQQKNCMMESVKQMVLDNKDEPYVLMWVLGNENNYGVACNADKFPAEYYKFINEIAKWIKKTDPNHPVAICNGDFLYLDLFARYCPDIDIFGSNSYRGKDGFGLSFWKSALEYTNKPVLITEYGCPAYHIGEDSETAEAEQAEYHKNCWNDIVYNSLGSGAGNAIGGVAFEWCDEWWKNGNALNADKHDETGQFTGPFPDGWLYEEWLGICGQGDGKNSPFQRDLRQVYYTYQKLWKE